MATIRKLKESGLSIVLVEQNPKLVFDVADDIVILNTGRVAVVSTPAQLDRTASICASISASSDRCRPREAGPVHRRPIEIKVTGTGSPLRG